LVKSIKLQLFVDKISSYPQFQQSFQHLTVKIRLKCLKPTVLLKTLLTMLKSIHIKACITLCKLIFSFSTSIFLQIPKFACISVKTSLCSFQHTVENYV